MAMNLEGTVWTFRWSRPVGYANKHLGEQLDVVRILSLIALMSVGAYALRGEGSADSITAAALEQSFQNVPSTPIDVALVPETGSPIVLEKLVVTDWWAKVKGTKSFETKPQPWLENVLKWNGRKWATKDFGPLRAEFGTWFKFGEKESGAIKERDIYIKVELVRLRW